MPWGTLHSELHLYGCWLSNPSEYDSFFSNLNPCFLFFLSTVQICQDFVQREWELQKGCGVCHIFISYWREPVLQQVPHTFKTASQVVRQRLWRSSILFLCVELSCFLIVVSLFKANATVFVCGWLIFVCVRENDESLFEAMQTFSMMNFSEPLLSDF